MNHHHYDATIISNTAKWVETELKNAEAGHDWWHIQRVWQMSKYLAKAENADLYVVELGALLHDIADHKFHNGDDKVGPQKAKDFLTLQNCDPAVIIHVVRIVENISYKGGQVASTLNSKEFGVVQDADRLDALGAIGIARAFNYGGYKNRPFYDPAIPPKLNMSQETYKNHTSPTINHFYEKLLLLKDKMNTNTGKKIAVQRHQYMQEFLKEFFKEWDYNHGINELEWE